MISGASPYLLVGQGQHLLIALFDGSVKKHTSTHSLNFDTFYLTN
jgi:hypothetical protein